MKKLFLSLVALIAATMSFAQSTLVATLSHGDEIRMYYGTNALRAAWAEAESGDVINLSGGNFFMGGETYTKAVTIRGTGIDSDFPSVLTNSVEINIPETETNTMSMEGIRCQDWVNVKGAFEKALFLKCDFFAVSWKTTSTNKNGFKFSDCIFHEEFNINENSTVNFLNCNINRFSNNSSSSSTALFINCILRISSSEHRSSFVNCILHSNHYADIRLPASCAAMNCLYIHPYYLYRNAFTNLSTAAINCNYESSYENVFKTFTGSFTDEETFELTDEAKAKYLGTDEKEIGIYGGDLPYSSTPSYPQITKMNVANKTTADGKLSVEIEVSAAE